LISQTLERPVFISISLVLTGVAFALAAIGLSGWLTDIAWMKNFLSDGATMKINTGLMLMSGSLAIWSWTFKQQPLYYFFLALLFVLAIVPLLEFVFGSFGNFDQILFKDHDTNPLREAPGRTSVLTAVNGLLIGLSLLTLKNRFYRSSQFLAMVSFLFVYTALLGHLFGGPTSINGAVIPVSRFIRRLHWVLLIWQFYCTKVLKAGCGSFCNQLKAGSPWPTWGFTWCWSYRS
jgi:hypothetical protein